MISKYWDDFRLLYVREKFLVISTLATMTVTFIVLGFFLSLVFGFHTAIKTLEAQAQVTLFFKDDFPESKILELQNQLNSDNRIMSVNYVSKADAFKIFTDINKEDPILLEAVTKDILPASLEIKAKNIASLSALSEEFKSRDGVEEVKFFRDVVDRFKYWANVVYVVGSILVLVFLTLSYSIILATLRINIAFKSDEIEVLKLVGASDNYISKPFKLQGVGFGLIASVIATLILSLMFISVRFLGIFSADSKFILVPGVRVGVLAFSIFLNMLLILSGIIVGYIGSRSAVSKYLKY